MTQPLRILQVCSSQRWIGEAAHTLHLSLALRERGHHVALVARSGQELETRAREHQLDCFPLQLNSRFNPTRDLNDWRALASYVKSFDPHLVHVHRSKEHWLTALALRPEIPIIRTRHVVTHVRNDPLNRWLYRRTASTLCVSQAAVSGYRQTGLDQHLATAIHVIYPGVRAAASPHATAAPAHTPFRRTESGETVALVVARLQRIKGHDILLDAIARHRLHERGLRVRLVGAVKNPDWRDVLARQIEEFGLTGAVCIEGYISAEALQAAYRQSDLCIVASRGSEGWSRAALEAMAAGLPLVATRVGALPEIVVDGETGILVPPEDPDALGAAIAALLDRPERRLRMGEAGCRRLHDHFTLERWVRDTTAHYASVLAAARRDCGASVLSDAARDTSDPEDRQYPAT